MLTKLFSRLTISNNFVNDLTNLQQIRGKFFNKPPRKRNPVWFIRKELKRCDEHITKENREFVKEVVQDTFGPIDKSGKEILTSKYLTPLKGDIVQKTEWTPKSTRCGLIARKIGVYPMWTKTGKRITSTLLQILDNQVIKHCPAGEYQSAMKSVKMIKNKRDCLLLGAEGVDPTRITKEYYGLFKEAGVMPKAILARFFVTPNCVLPVGTCLNVMHFRVGDYVDIIGLTKYRGFQGVMKRWGFKGMPATHGVTKTHRRPGNIGGGGEKGRVWPGKKMPGHMGNRYRITKGIKIIRINPKYNVMWIKGQAIPGATNSICFIHDCILPNKRPSIAHSPTFIIDDQDSQCNLENDIYDPEIHNFADPTIMYEVETKKKK